MTGERYEEIAPPDPLRPFVRAVWTYVAPSPSGAVQRIAPDGCPELILHLGTPYEEQDGGGDWRLQPGTVFAGQLTRPLALRPAGPVAVIAVRFEPDGASGLMGAPMAGITDRRIDMTDRLADLWSALSGADPVSGTATAIVIDWIEGERRREDWRLDPLVRAEIDAATAEQPTRHDAARRRALQRRFRDRVGVAPQMLRSILRFRRVFDYAAEPGVETGAWLNAGLDAGYFDQPQLARDFRRFLGCTATQWAREQVELARRIASRSYKPDHAGTGQGADLTERVEP